MKVLLVDDHPLFLEGLKSLLLANEFEVVGTAVNGREALWLAEMLRPEVIFDGYPNAGRRRGRNNPSY